jgi:IS30 family transposase
MNKYRQLAQEERYLIAAHLSAGQSLTWIACELGRSKGTISRELQRNATRHDGAYRPRRPTATPPPGADALVGVDASATGT